MKKIIIFIAIFAFGDETKEILNMIKLLHNKDFSYVEVNSIYNPFVKNKTYHPIQIQLPKIIIPKKEPIKYKLEAIFQNKAKINGIWYKNYSKLDKYTIIITNNKVYLKNKKEIIDLTKKQTLLKVQ